MLATILLLAACQGKNNQTKDFIPGTYVNAAKGEYAIADDTLIIEHIDGNNYRITRRTTYQAIRNGKLLPKHHQIKKLNAVWDSGKRELDELITGRIFRFDTRRHLLLTNQAGYHKIN